MSCYRFTEVQRDHYPVRLLCQELSVPASGYYAWQQAQQQRVALCEPARETALVKEFGVHKRCYGTRRLQLALRKNGHLVGCQRLRAAMRRRGLRALQPKAFTLRATDSTHGLRCAPNRLLDQPKPTQANHIWVSGITYLTLANGDWPYRCAFQDMVSKQVVGLVPPGRHCASGGHYARRTGDKGLTTSFLVPAAHSGPARALRPRRAVLRQRLSVTATRPRGPALAEPPR